MPCPVCRSTSVKRYSFGTVLTDAKNLKGIVKTELVVCAICGNVYDRLHRSKACMKRRNKRLTPYIS